MVGVYSQPFSKPIQSTSGGGDDRLFRRQRIKFFISYSSIDPNHSIWKLNSFKKRNVFLIWSLSVISMTTVRKTDNETFCHTTIFSAEKKQLIDETVDNFNAYINPGFLKYRKSFSSDYVAGESLEQNVSDRSFSLSSLVEWADSGSTFTCVKGIEYIDCLGGYGIYKSVNLDRSSLRSLCKSSLRLALAIDIRKCWKQWPISCSVKRCIRKNCSILCAVIWPKFSPNWRPVVWNMHFSPTVEPSPSKERWKWPCWQLVVERSLQRLEVFTGRVSAR